MRILGLNYSSHDAAAAIVENGCVIAACEEERCNHEKHTKKFPVEAIKVCLDIAKMDFKDIDRIAFFINPRLHYKLLTNNVFSEFPKSLQYIPRGIALIKKRYGMKKLLESFVGSCNVPPVDYVQHHLAHSASSFYLSPFEQSGILTLDGRGEYETITLSSGEGTKIKKIKSIEVPHSLGYFYTMVTKYLGFKQHHDEYKVMGLSAYGDESLYNELSKVAFIDKNGDFKLDLSCFDHHYKWGKDRNLFTKEFIRRFGPPRQSDEPLNKNHANMARAVQKVTENLILHLAKETARLSGKKNLCLAGGVALNCLANQRILESGLFEKVFVQPASNDAGTSIGAALSSYYSLNPDGSRFPFSNIYLGPAFSNEQILRAITQQTKYKFDYTYVKSPQLEAARLIHEGNIIGWFQGRMEFGPRALGNRSILASPRDRQMKDKINKKIKFREPFRPFAPSVTSEYADKFFKCLPSGIEIYPFMLATADVIPNRKEDIPAVTHDDGTARLQVVYKDRNPDFWGLIENYRKLSGIPLVLNTSFNINKEPIVCSPEDAVYNFSESGLDYLVMGNYVLKKN
jgi:carbamoyltransferase